MIHADMLFLMTDVDCLYDKNPRSNPDAKPIEVVEDIAALQADGENPFLIARFALWSLTVNSFQCWLIPWNGRHEYKDCCCQIGHFRRCHDCDYEVL
jgi:hypothetical protein